MVPERTQARANPARGLALIATAVIVALFLLRNWDGSSAGGAEQVASGGDAGGEEAADPGATDPAAGGTTTTLPPARPPGEVTVRVLNATSVPGAAGGMTTTLQEGDYKTVEPDDAGQMLDTTKILFAAGFDREAADLASAVGSPANSLEPLTDQFDPAGANLVLLLGSDLAG